MTRVVHCAILLACILVMPGQASAQIAFDSLTVAWESDSLRKLNTANIQVPDKYARAFFKAFSYMPELENAKIRFKEAKIKTTLNARPTVGSLLFRKRENRSYVIRINTQSKDSLVLLEDVPFNAQIGLFGHELKHFCDYRSKSFGQVLGRLFSYAGKKGKTRFEKEIDSLTIACGLGWQLYEWSTFVLEKSKASAKYKAYKREVYLEPEEILLIMERMSRPED